MLIGNVFQLGLGSVWVGSIFGPTRTPNRRPRVGYLGTVHQTITGVKWVGLVWFRFRPKNKKQGRDGDKRRRKKNTIKRERWKEEKERER